MKILLFLMTFALVHSSFAQDKTNIPPGPEDQGGTGISVNAVDSRVIKMQVKDFKKLEKQFIKIVNVQKYQCSKNKTIHEETSLLSLYLVSVFKDSIYKPCLPCGDKAEDFKHHPDVQCLFKNNEVIRKLSDLMNHPAMNKVLLERKSTQNSFGEMVIYYSQILKDYAY